MRSATFVGLAPSVFASSSTAMVVSKMVRTLVEASSRRWLTSSWAMLMIPPALMT